MRLTVGVLTLIQGGFYVSTKSETMPGAWIGLVVGVVAGAALLFGLLTPIAALVTGLAAIGTGMSLLPAPVPNLCDSTLSVALIGIVTIAIIFLGPGAFSLDGRLFGRREIIIPRRPEP